MVGHLLNGFTWDIKYSMNYKVQHISNEKDIFMTKISKFYFSNLS